MTSQAHDTVRYEGEEWALVAVAGTGLVAIADHGVEPRMPMTTACWRGHLCDYAVEGGRLVLARLRLPSAATLHGRPLAAGDALLGGTVEVVEREASSWAGERFVLRDAAWPVPFTGTLLLGLDVVSRGPHMGFWPAWRFGRVVELDVDGGEVTAAHDRSAEMAETRRAIEEGTLPDPDGRRGGMAWVRRTDSLGYDRSVPPAPPAPTAPPLPPLPPVVP